MKSSERIPLTAIILSYNEEHNLGECLESIAGWTKQTFVVDSGSRDRTKEIALKYGVSFVEHAFETHAKQWRWALSQLPVSTNWVLGLDADQYVTAELKEEITQLFTKDKSRLLENNGFYLNRRQIFRGRWIRHGGYYPKYLLKLFQLDKVRTDEHDLVDHHFYVQGKVDKLRADLVEDNRKEEDISFWIEKHNRYAQLQAKEEFLRRINGKSSPIQPNYFGNPDQKVAWLKRQWTLFPLYVRPCFYFIYRYFLKLGFLDGKEGFIFHFLHGFWYPLLIDIHLEKLLEESR